jgi:hypothetical protein
MMVDLDISYGKDYIVLNDRRITAFKMDNGNFSYRVAKNHNEIIAMGVEETLSGASRNIALVLGKNKDEVEFSPRYITIKSDKMVGRVDCVNSTGRDNHWEYFFTLDCLTPQIRNEANIYMFSYRSLQFNSLKKVIEEASILVKRFHLTLFPELSCRK